MAILDEELFWWEKFKAFFKYVCQDYVVLKRFCKKDNKLTQIALYLTLFNL